MWEQLVEATLVETPLDIDVIEPPVDVDIEPPELPEDELPSTVETPAVPADEPETDDLRWVKNSDTGNWQQWRESSLWDNGGTVQLPGSETQYGSWGGGDNSWFYDTDELSTGQATDAIPPKPTPEAEVTPPEPTPEPEVTPPEPTPEPEVTPPETTDSASTDSADS